MSVTFRIKASEAQGRRLDPEYHHALRRTRIRSTYPSAKLLSLSYFRTGGTPSTAHPEYWNGSIPWVSAKDFKAFRFEDSEDHVTELALAESTTCYVNRPAVLMVSRSGILQHTLPVMVTHKPTTINQDIKAFFPDDRVSVDYLGAFFDVFGSRLLPLVCKNGATVQSQIRSSWKMKNMTKAVAECHSIWTSCSTFRIQRPGTTIVSSQLCETISRRLLKS